MSEILKKLKKSYLDTPIPGNLETNGWINVNSRLDRRSWLNGPQLRKPFYFFASLVLLLTTLTATAQAAGPGDILYPIKLLSDQIQARITHNSEKVLEKRTDDIVKVSNEQSPEKVDKAVDAYRQTLIQSENSMKKEEEKNTLRQNLDTQEQKLEQVAKDHPDISPKINKAIEETKKAQGEVEGVSNNLLELRVNH